MYSVVMLFQVQNLEFMLERQNVDIKQLSRLTYKLQDDIYQSGSRKDKSKGSSKSSESSASSSNALQETSFDIDSSSHVEGTDEAVSRGNGWDIFWIYVKEIRLFSGMQYFFLSFRIVTSALNDLLGPASQEFEEVISGELSYDSRGSVIVVPGLVTEAVDHFLNSCQDADHEMRRRDWRRLLVLLMIKTLG